MNQKYLDCLFLLKHAILTLESLDYDEDLINKVRLIFNSKKQHFIKSKITKNDLNVIENYLVYLSTLDVDKIKTKTLKIL